MGTAERRERERQQRMDTIMDAALEVFAEKGLRYATMDDIAEKAELSKGAIYLYFKSKETVFLGIDARANKILRERFVEAARGEQHGMAQVLAIGYAYFKFCYDYPNYFKAMAYVDNMSPEVIAALQDEPAAQESHKQGELSLEVLANAIEKGKQDGTIDEDADPWVTSVLLWSLSNGVIQMLKNRKEHFELHGLNLDPLFDEFIKMVGRGLSPRS